MKNLKFILFILLISSLSFSQNMDDSKGINYKALIKDNNNNVLSNHTITIEFSILEGPEINFGDEVYVETHIAMTDANGIIIVNIGEGIPESGFEDAYALIDWGSYFNSHFLKVRIDTGSGFTDMGTTEFKAVPYALYAERSNNSGLEAINEGNGTGRRLIGSIPENYGPIANNAVDLSYSPGNSETRGATGNYATALGYQTTASGQGSLASGINSIASGTQSTALGAGTLASGHSSTAIGIGTKAEAPNSTAIGLYNIGGGDPLLASPTDPLFEIGNGNYVDGSNDVRTNALTVLRNGTITAPSFDISEITNPKALITKEFADANYSGGGSGTNPTGLEAIDEGNGVGWRLIGSNPANFGNIGLNAVDLSISINPSSSYGATGNYSTAMGGLSTASGYSSTAIGIGALASGLNSIVLGNNSQATGDNSIAFGNLAQASGEEALAIGNSRAFGNGSFSFGFLSVANGRNATAIGSGLIVDAFNSMSIGQLNVGGGNLDSWIETDPLFEIGNSTDVANRSNALTVLKNGTITAPSFDISEITDPKALITKEFADANYSSGSSGSSPTGLEAINEGNGVGWRLIGTEPMNYGDIGWKAVDLSFSQFNGDSGAIGNYSFASGVNTTASESNSIAMGSNTTASGESSTAIGTFTEASGINSTSLGSNTIASGLLSISMGYFATASGENSISIGSGSNASGNHSLAMGYDTTASNTYSTAMGFQTQASGGASFATGEVTIASGITSTAMGLFTISDDNYSTVIGRYNDNTFTTSSLFQVGNGVSTINSNAFTVMDNGYTSVGTHNEEPTTDFQVYHDNGGTENGFKLKNKGSNKNWWRLYTLNSNGDLYMYSKAGGNAAAVGSFNDVSGAYTALSDRRVKDDFKDLYFNWEHFMQLRPLTYHYKTDKNKKSNIGFIAQDVDTIYPELVNYNIEDDLYQLNYSGFGVVAIKAIQEQQKVITSQQARIDILEAKLAEKDKAYNELSSRIETIETLLNHSKK